MDHRRWVINQMYVVPFPWKMTFFNQNNPCIVPEKPTQIIDLCKELPLSL